MNLKENILIFSVFSRNKTLEENENSHGMVIAELKKMGIGYVELLGRYNGVDEKSILVRVINKQIVERYVIKYNQESYLESLNDRSTYLIYKDRTKYIGILKNVSKEKAMNSIGYTYNPKIDAYFVAE